MSGSHSSFLNFNCFIIDECDVPVGLGVGVRGQLLSPLCRFRAQTQAVSSYCTFLTEPSHPPQVLFMSLSEPKTSNV